MFRSGGAVYCFRSMEYFILLCTGIYRRCGLAHFQHGFVLLVWESGQA